MKERNKSYVLCYKMTSIVLAPFFTRICFFYFYLLFFCGFGRITIYLHREWRKRILYILHIFIRGMYDIRLTGDNLNRRPLSLKLLTLIWHDTKKYLTYKISPRFSLNLLHFLFTKFFSLPFHIIYYIITTSIYYYNYSFRD